MEEVLYQFPCYTQKIINSLIDRDWFIHSFDLQNVHDIYNPAGYLYHSEFEDIEYSIFLDLNIYQYVLSSIKKQNKNQLHRDAVALIVFARLANMNFDPTLAVYEKLNYLEECPDDLIDDLELFRRIDDSELEGLAKFALGLENSFPVVDIAPIDKENLKSELTRFRRLKKWDTFYLFVLKIVELYFFNSSTNEEKIRRFLQWSFRDFKYSLVAISFVLKLLGDRPKAKLMKYKLSHNAAEKQDGEPRGSDSFESYI